MRVYDPSSIYDLLVDGKAIEFDESATLELATFEVGNVIWKQYSLLQTISASDAAVLMKTAVIFLRNLIHLQTEFEETLKFAVREKITFYDASYIVAAIRSESILVTEDTNQKNVARKYLKVESAFK